MITEFKGKHFFLSNFFVENLQTDITNEHRFQSKKAKTRLDQQYVLEAPTPSAAKRRGNEIPIRPDWEEVKVSIMLRCLLEKFEDANLRKRLVATYPHFLQEGNAWNDTFWGVSLESGQGRNMLGKLLMLVRDIHMSKSRLDFPGDLPFV